MGAKQFDYYIFIDYSEEFIGYIIIERGKIQEIMPKISKLRHYKEVNDKNTYLKALKKSINKNCLHNSLYSCKIKKMISTLEIYADIADFIFSNKNSKIFISLDDNQVSNFERMVRDIDGEKVRIIREGKLKRGSVEQRLSLIIDNLLNIERKDEVRK